MGKLAGAAIKVAAPEAAVAGKVAGAAGGKRKKPPVPDPRESAPGSEAARQRQAVEDVKARRKPEPEESSEESTEGSSEGSSSSEGSTEGSTEGSSGGGPSLGNPLAGMSGPSTGGGFLLGVLIWAVARAYIGNPGEPSGGAGVKRLLLAKFLNKTS